MVKLFFLRKAILSAFKRTIRPQRMAQMYVYSYEQLLAIVNQQATTIAQRGAVINNLRIEREWLEEDNKLQREEVEKANKKIAV